MKWAFYLQLLVLLVIATLILGAIEFDDDYEYEDDDNEETFAQTKTVNTKTEPSSALKTSRPTIEESKEVTFKLEHSVGKDFTPCGTFTALVLEQTTGASTIVKVAQLKLQRDPLSAQEKKQLTALLENGGYYRLRVPSSIVSSAQVPLRVQAGLPLKCLVNSGLQESLGLHLDDQGNILALDYSTPTGDCFLDEAPPPPKWDFHSTVYTRLPKDAPRLNPDYAMNYHAPPTPGGPTDSSAGGEGLAKSPDDGKKAPPQSFFKKYWMYIVPAGLILLNGALSPPEQPAGVQGATRPKTS
mmetsp:Transcript_18608/g.25799  ORF Transcript_18608/g.25799 Transcript_18608/m.25799 type:complete len:299 (-) Transcript_18608:235-1131(-)|eukprot:CAMPEP_0196581150 /NCGR_PEP_ID=MMETSP1081-20130531/32668_1 /TAXON_ID=36882 /ORGANISM="Pyramimonas amylifera, Strain CCMP720" /LENGTH=298 /DNA_ID=CAMNT_0041901269 /DNA_START=93 /DNA_END=989 /DNA_ORIENTATION=+